jgi:hypothetical protein
MSVKFSTIFFINIIFFLCTNCKKHVPAKNAYFIKSSDVSVITSYSLQGSNSNNITDLFLYNNGKFQGIYPVGSLLPIVTIGESNSIAIFPGIKNNGISNTRIPYGLYDKFILDTVVESGSTIQMPLTFKYESSVKFSWIEDFDLNGISVTNSSSSTSTFVILNDQNSKEGKYLRLSLVNKDFGKVESSSNGFTLPLRSSNVYLEFDYKCNQEFEVGVKADQIDRSALNINPKENWNKIYVQLAEVINRNPIANSYKIYFSITKKVDDPVLFLDNIKLVHF